MHDQSRLSIKNIIQCLLSWVTITKPINLVWFRLIHLRLNRLQRTCLKTVFHLLVKLFDASHDLISIKKGSTFLLFESIPETFTNSNDQPQVTGKHLAHFVTVVVIG